MPQPEPDKTDKTETAGTGDARFQLFPLGRVVATPGATEALHQIAHETNEHEAEPILRRHARGDWGELDAEDKAMNERQLRLGGRLMSQYTLSTGVKVWVITDGDRRTTTILLPDEY